jgi:hypothetical protein
VWVFFRKEISFEQGHLSFGRRTRGVARRSPRPRSAGALSGSFTGMLAKLGLASTKLHRARKKR